MLVGAPHGHGHVRPKVVATQCGNTGKQRLDLRILEGADPDVVNRFIENNSDLLDEIRHMIDERWQ